MEVSEFKNIIWDYTRKIAESTNNAFNPVCEQYGLTMMQVRILVGLYQCESHTVGSLAESICVAGANISAMCKKLEANGFLERIRDKGDERVVRIVLTQIGKETVLEINKSLNEKISKHITNETEETFEYIILGLERLNTFLQKISKVEEE